MRDIARIHGKQTFREILRELWTKSEQTLKNLWSSPLERSRLRKGQFRTIRADIVTGGAWKDSTQGRTCINVLEQDGGAVTILLPDKSLSDFATAAFQSIRDARSIPSTAPGGPIPETRSRIVVPDRIEILAEPEGALALPGHEVLELWIGGVPLHFSAQKETWKLVLEALSNRPNA